MKRFRMKFCLPASQSLRLNCLAALISLFAFSVLLLNFQATPAGAGLDPVDPMPMTIPLPKTQIASRVPDGATAAESVGTTISTQELNQQIHEAVNTSRVALQLHVTLLELGKHRMDTMPDYTAQFIKQERRDGEDLQDRQVLQLKLRHKPFSVYLKWMEGGDVGREVLYVDGQQDNKMLVHIGGLKGRLLPHLKLEPTSAMAMSEARHPVTEMGLQQLCELLLKYRKRDLQLKQGVRWQMLDEQKFSDRDCYCFIVEYDNREVEPVYRKSITYIDKELSLPVCVRNFGWTDDTSIAAADLDEQTLIEFYGYQDIQFDQRLSDADFDKTNKQYTFKR